MWKLFKWGHSESEMEWSQKQDRLPREDKKGAVSLVPSYLWEHGVRGNLFSLWIRPVIWIIPHVRVYVKGAEGERWGVEGGVSSTQSLPQGVRTDQDIPGILRLSSQWWPLLCEGNRVHVCVFLDLHGLFRLSPHDPPGQGVMHLELFLFVHHLRVSRSSNPRSHHEKCCRKDV